MGGTQKSIDHLGTVAPMVTGIAILSQGAGMSFKITGGDIEHQDITLTDMETVKVLPIGIN